MPNKYNIVNFIIAIALLSALGLIRFFYSRYMLELIDKFKQKNSSIRQAKDELNTQTQSSVLLNIFGYLMIGVFIVTITQVFHIVISFAPYQFFLICIITVPIAILLKRLVIILISHVFKMNHVLKIYLFQMSLMRKIVGLALAPILSLYFALNQMVLRNVFFYAACIVSIFIFVFTLYKILSSMLKSSSFRINLHFFLYLCAIEILPIIILLKKI